MPPTMPPISLNAGECWRTVRLGKRKTGYGFPPVYSFHYPIEPSITLTSASCLRGLHLLAEDGRLDASKVKVTREQGVGKFSLTDLA